MRWAERGPVLVTVVAVVGYLVFVVPQLSRPLMYDDANFALAIKAVADTGLPYGNQGWMSERGDFSQREQWALWHPPLYVYADGLIARLAGWSAPVMRLLGVVAGLATATLSFRLAADITRGPPAAKRVAGAAAAVLVLLNPLVVQSTLILDIDFPILLPLTLVFLVAYARVEAGPRAWLWLAPLFGLLLWAKMTNPLPLVGLIGAWQVVRGHPARGLVQATTIGVGGALLFGLTWVVIGSRLGFLLDMPFGVNLVQWRDSADVARQAYLSPGAFVEAMQPTVLWLGPALVVLGLAAVALRAGELVRAWEVRHADLLIGLLIAFVLGYANKHAGWFPKYQVAMTPLLACLAAPLFARVWCSRPRLTLGLGVAGAIIGGLIELGLVRDAWALQRTYSIDPGAGIGLLGGVLLATLVAARWRAPAAGFVAALVGLGLGWSIGLDAWQVSATYQTDYWYGTTGTQEAAAWVDLHLAPEQTYVAAKEVAIRTHDLRYVDQETLLSELSTGRPFSGQWAGEPLHAFVTWQRERFVADLFSRALPAAGFHETARFGDYVIYQPAPTS